MNDLRLIGDWRRQNVEFCVQKSLLLLRQARAQLGGGGGDGLGGRGGQRVAEDDDDAVPSEEHILDEPVLVDGFGLLLALALLGHLGPHLLHILQHHVAVAIERLDAAEKLLVVAHIDEDLRVGLHRLG